MVSFFKPGTEYVNHELPDIQAGFRKVRGTRDQIDNIHWIMEKAREFQKNLYFCFTDYAKAFDCVNHNKLWKILKEMGIPDLICLLSNPLQCSCLENPRDGRAWWAAVYGVAQSRIRLK